MEFRLRRKTSSQGEESPKKKKKEQHEKFTIHEKVLCFEPDTMLEKVLYDAKIRDVAEGKDKKGKKTFEYLVHFQGWNKTWDRRVGEDFLLKDNAENRKLQRDLAEKSQLQLGAHLYRKERKKRKKMHEMKMLMNSDDTKKAEDQQENEQEYYSSSATESHDDDRVFLHMGEELKSHLEYEHRMITKEQVKSKLPAAIPIVTILENFVKSHAIKVLTGPQAEPPKVKRRSSSILGIRKEPKVKQVDYEGLANGIDLCKEVADGLRVYFNFILRDFLLYVEEKEEMEQFMSEEQLKDFKFEPGEQLKITDFFSKQEPPKTPTVELSTIPENAEGSTSSNADKRPSRLRSHSVKTEEDDRPENLSSLASTSSNDSALPDFQKKGIFSKTWFPLNAGLSPIARKIIEETFSWRMIPPNSEPEPSMIYGIYHLTRLVVKLPEFLSATPMNEEKLTMLLKYLDSFVEFLEENSEVYGPQNFITAGKVDVKPEKDVKIEISDDDSCKSSSKKSPKN